MTNFSRRCNGGSYVTTFNYVSVFRGLLNFHSTCIITTLAHTVAYSANITSVSTCAFQFVYKHAELKHAVFPELWVLQRFKTAKVTCSLTQGHWQSCHLIGHTCFPISLPFLLCLCLAPFLRYHSLLPNI